MPAARGGVQRGEVEGLVEDARVDPAGGGRRRGEQVGVAGDLALQVGGDAEPLGCVLEEAGPADGLEDRRAGRAELGKAQPVEVEVPSARCRRLPLGGWQEDEHRRSLGDGAGSSSGGGG